MKFIHLADLHLGKNVNGYSMIEDQKYALNKIIELLDRKEVRVLLIAGDVYQNSVPSAEAMRVFDDFISRLSKMGVTVLIIAGNHDSADRLAYASSILTSADVHISSPYRGSIEKVTLTDEYGPINFYLFPYIRPHDVKGYFEDKEISTFSEAIQAVLESIEVNEAERNIILSHQFILNAEQSESEEIYAGTAEAVADIYYDKFDYVALGHIHKKQNFLNGKLRYPGALLKYASSESGYDKTISLVEIAEKGSLSIVEHKIDYLRDMRIIRGKFDDIVKNSHNDDRKDDYIHIEIEDESDIHEGFSRLRKIYPNLLTYRMVNSSYGDNDFSMDKFKSQEMNPLELFESFFKERMGRDLDQEKKDLIEKSIEEVWTKHEGN